MTYMSTCTGMTTTNLHLTGVPAVSVKVLPSGTIAVTFTIQDSRIEHTLFFRSFDEAEATLVNAMREAWRLRYEADIESNL